MDGDGDITRPENITAFRNFVLESTEKRGLHFLMADGVRLFHSFVTTEYICSYFSASKHSKIFNLLIKQKTKSQITAPGGLN